jgi:hypothetical protein
MTGNVLGYEVASNSGTILGVDGKRYKFTKDDWKEDFAPQKDIKVDFDIAEDNTAKDIYQIRDKVAENSDTMMGLLAIAITFFFGFIGTFISRVVLSKQPVGKAIIPTLIHFVITLLVVVPVIGWFVYIIGTGYYMYKNYILVTTGSHTLKSKYE